MATSVGLVGPLLKDAGLLGRPVGRLTLAGAALGEVTAVLLISVGFSVSHGPAAAFACARRRRGCRWLPPRGR